MDNKKVLTVIRGIVINPQTGKICICQNPPDKKQDGGLFCFPGGKPEYPTEPEPITAEREVRQETGIVFKPEIYLMPTVNLSPKGPGLSAIITSYMSGQLIEIVNPDNKHDDSPSTILWLTPIEALNLPLTVSARLAATQITKINLIDLLKI